MKKSSILNDVLGPVMAGPSSSHTAGPGKIGLAVRSMWGKKIRNVDVVYEQGGSYPSTHVGQGSDFGFAAGLMGMTTDDPRFRDSLSLAGEQGVNVTFRFADLGLPHPNTARIDVVEDGKVQLSALSFSTGGGTFEIVEMDGFAIRFDGQREKWWLCCSDGMETVRAYLTDHGVRFTQSSLEPARVSCITGLPGRAVLFEVEASALSEREKQDLTALSREAVYLRKACPVVPAALRLNPEPPFVTAAGALEYARRHPGTGMPALARLYESSLSTLSAPEADERMMDVCRSMRASMQPPPKDDPVQNLIVPRIADQLSRLSAMPVDMGVMNSCMACAVAVMENSCAHRTVVAAPTAGSSGVIPAAVLSVGQSLGCTEEQTLDALWNAGLIGAWIANQATFGAEVAGCQAEIGAAAAMAAGGVVQLLGGDIDQSMNSACIALQSLLGLICDPIGGLTEFPCIERNVTASAVAVMSANMALCGMRSLIPLDETIQTMLRVGQMLPRELCCTCEGGLCTTPTGLHLAQAVKERQQT